MRKIVMAGLVAAAAVLGCTGPAFAGTGTDRPAGAPSTRAANTRASLERLSAARSLAATSVGQYAETGLSCASPTACLNVGYQIIASGNTEKFVPTAQRLHAGTWKSVPVKAPKGAVMTMLEGVSCKAATYCLAVGDSLSNVVISGSRGASIAGAGSIDGDSPIVMSWDGSTLTRLAAPPVPKADELDGLGGVSCVAVRSCVVLGLGDVVATGDMVQFVWTLNGTKWALSTIPAPGSNVSTAGSTGLAFNGLRCFSLTSCVAVGDSYTSTENAAGVSFTSTPLAEYWNGTTITSMKAPTPSGTSDAVLTGLSCVSSHACAVVGVATDKPGADNLGFAEMWNGKTWTVTKWIGPKGGTYAQLFSVSCTSAVRCIAVGLYGTDTTIAPAALAWSGTKWKVLNVPGAGKGRTAIFENVSCPGNGKCVATGDIGKATGLVATPLAGYWNGRAWKYGPMFSAAAG